MEKKRFVVKRSDCVVVVLTSSVDLGEMKFGKSDYEFINQNSFREKNLYL